MVEGNFTPPVFSYKGKDYRVAQEGGIAIAIERNKLPETLTRVTIPRSLTFDEKDILSPQNSSVTNDMVSAAYPDEWEKFARMFHFGKEFQLTTIDRDNLVGPTLLAGNRILTHGEVLTLVPKEAIKGAALYIWGPAEKDYDYGEDAYANEADRGFYRRLVVDRTRGSKPYYVRSLSLDEL